MRSLTSSALLLIQLACWAPGSQAVPITFHYAGTVKYVQGDDNPLVAEGQPISAQITIESSSPDQEPDETLGLYPGAIIGFVIDVPLELARYTATSGDVEIDVFEPAFGSYSFFAPNFSGPDIFGWTPRGGSLSFIFPRHPEAMPNDDLPLTPPDPRDFHEANFFISFLAPDAEPGCTDRECLGIIAARDSFQVVPEPSALSLMMMVLAPILLLAETRRLRRHSSLLRRRDTTHARPCSAL